MTRRFEAVADANVLIAGVGGLGCPGALALAQAGVRKMTLIDPDRVDLSNLHRQLWFRAEDIGRPKAQCARERLDRAFPQLRLTALSEAISQSNVEDLFRTHDLVIDGTDDWRTKLLLSDAAVATDVSLVYGGVLRWSGQAMRVSTRGVCLRCLFEAPEGLPTCAQAGVMGSVAGVVGGLQALIAYESLIGGLGELPEGMGRMLVFDGEALTQRAVTVKRPKDCRHELYP